MLLGQFQKSIEFWVCLLKNALRSRAMAINWIWQGWVIESKIHLTEWIVSVMTMMWEASEIWMAWLILHLIANDSASVDVILTAW